MPRGVRRPEGRAHLGSLSPHPHLLVAGDGRCARSTRPRPTNDQTTPRSDRDLWGPGRRALRTARGLTDRRRVRRLAAPRVDSTFGAPTAATQGQRGRKSGDDRLSTCETHACVPGATWSTGSNVAVGSSSRTHRARTAARSTDPRRCPDSPPNHGTCGVRWDACGRSSCSTSTRSSAPSVAPPNSSSRSPLQKRPGSYQFVGRSVSSRPIA